MKGILEGPALKYFYMIHRGGRTIAPFSLRKFFLNLKVFIKE